MIIFLDENDVEYGALATIKATNAVNGERSLTGTIVSGDYVLSKIERGWRLRFEDEYYAVTYAKPIDEGKNVQVSFDAVHQFFWDFGKSSVYDQLSDGSHTFRAYLDFIFNDSGYRYDIESSLTVKAFEKQSFGYKNRLSLFNDVITSSGVEFQVNGKVVRILAKVGTDLSTVVRKNFNLNELGIEKNISNFVTYQKGFGAYFDEEDHSKGRLIAEYTSPLASVYGKLEADPLVDERYKQQASLLSALKETVDNSYTISVSLDMEDLTRAGYRYTQPVAGDYIMAINETLGFKEKIRIVSFTSEYDVAGQLIKHTVTCNDIGSVKKLSASYTQTQHQAANAEVNANTAYEFANKALVSADGKNTNYYGDSFPVDNPKGTLKKGDLLFLTVGDTVKQYYWNGAEWVTNPVVSDVEAFKEQIAEELKDVPNREEFENKISEEIANSKAEIETQIETAKTQAESNAKEYADTINQETAKVAEQANAAAGEIKADLVNVKNNLTSTSLVANNAQAAVDEAKKELTKVIANVDSAKAELTQTKQDLSEVANELNTAKQDLASSVAAVDTKADSTKEELTQAKQDLVSHAQQLQTQANAQTELTKRVSTVETTANGTKTTVSELSKTVDSNTKNITSVTARTKVVEDDLSGTKTTLSQVKTTADSASQKTATLETGLNGLNAKFDSLSVGGVNLFKGSRDFSGTGWVNNSNGAYVEDYQGVKIFKTQDSWNGRSQYFEVKTGEEYVFSAYVKSSAKTDRVTFYLTHGSKKPQAEGLVGFESADSLDAVSFDLTDEYKRIAIKIKITSAGWIMPRIERFNSDAYLFFGGYKLENGNVVTDYSSNEADIEQKVAEYKQNADQNYASLSSTVQNLDGTVQHNKTVADQTAEGFKTRIESLETYKDGESTRANQYFELAKTETARQLSVERTAIAKDYVAKSTYTSDVTGIRNELSATTTTANATKTNLANYQASNDKVVASLKSSLQTTDGKVSNLQTKVEAVPGQITSAVSAVEGKIPTNVSTRNLILKSNDLANPHKQSGANTTVTSTDEYFIVKSAGYTANAFGGMSWNMSISEMKAGEQFSILMPVYIDSSISLDNGWAFTLKNHPSNSAAYSYDIPTNKKDQWFNVAITFKASKDVVFDTYPFFVYLVKNGLVRIKPPMIVRGNLIPSDYQPAFEDTESDISTVSSQIKQTADGMTLLATKTELSTTKSELQSGINTATNKANNAQAKADSNAQTITTHTTQISALNTGLQAKVSQSDFNTLSGRVTNAENNITAKANELSSKITSVEGKIPKDLGGRNLIVRSQIQKGYIDANGNLATATNQFTTGFIDGTNDKQFTITAPKFLVGKLEWLRLVKYGADKNFIERDVISYDKGTKTIKTITLSDNVSYFKVSFDGAYGEPFKIERGSIATDWSPAPEDAIEEISSLSSEIKQTADGMTLLATKTELSSAKTELQSGINTATNKANAAQSTANNAQSTANNAQSKANSNAQTISTHTTQISALNTGLSAKVSQSDFNTLSGRVTTAENNIVAKANELSSKITSVEGKIPTSVSQRNLVRGTSDSWSPFVDINKNSNWSYDLATVRYGDSTGIYAGRTINLYVYLSADNIMLDSSISPRFFIQGAIIDKNGDETWTDWEKYHPFYNKWSTNLAAGNNFRVVKLSTKVTSESYESINGFKLSVRLDGVRSGKFHYRSLMVTTGDVFPDSWQPAPEDAFTQINSVSSEIKQTTDAIKASVSSLDNSTVKSSSLTINTDGVVIKAGKSTSDFANAVGSYFSVNQNAINLFSDKINVKGSMIVSGAITSDKIASKQINTAHLNGKIITADVISSNAVTADAIRAGAVTTDKMSANSINGDRITAGTLDAAKIKAGSITASQIASGTITSAQIKTGTISAANIAAGAITSDKIAANSIDASKIAANAISANMITGGQLRSTNGATVFDLNAGTLTFNNNYGYIQRVAGDKIFEITTWLHGADASSQEYLTSAFKIRKSDYSRLAGAEFTLYNATIDKPTALAKINADTLTLSDSQNRTVLSIFSKGAFGNVNFQGWGDIPVAHLTNCGLLVKDIGIGGHTKSLLNIVEELCKKAGIIWV